MSERSAKRRRTSTNPYLDLEAAVDREDELEEREDDEDRAFIDDGLEGAGDDAGSRQHLVNFLREDGQLGDGGALGEQDNDGDDDDDDILREIFGLEQDAYVGEENPLILDDETDEEDEEERSVPRPQWAELGHVNAAVSGALDTWRNDNDERRVTLEDSLYEVSCQPGMEKTIAFRIFSWAMQVDSLGPTPSHILERHLPSNSSASRLEPESSRRKREPLARAAIANPYLRGRVYIESAKISYVQRLARRVRGLNPASVRPVPREFLLGPLTMMKHSFPDRTFVRLLTPPCPSMTCLVVEDQLLMVPSYLHSTHSHSSMSKFDADTDVMVAPPPKSRNNATVMEKERSSDNIQRDQYGFRYYPLKLLGPTSLEAYEPSVDEIELLFQFNHLDNRQYERYMSRAMANSFSSGDRVTFQGGPFQSLVGAFLNSGPDGSCSVYVPSQGCIVHVVRQHLRRYFCVGDRVSATTNDVVEKLGSRFGWVVRVSDEYRTTSSSANDGGTSTDQLKASPVYRADLSVFSPKSGREIIAAHYEFQFEDDSSVLLQTTPMDSPVSEMTKGKFYTLTIPLGLCRHQSFTGVIDRIEGVHVHLHGTDKSKELAATIVFSIWDKSNDARYGYPRNWIVAIPDFSDYNIALGQTITLKDREGRCGTARITCLGTREVTLANFTGALKFADSVTVSKAGPYDSHIGKTVRVAKGPWKGGIGPVQAVNAVGLCTVELQVQPIKKINIHINRLRIVDETELYVSLVKALSLPDRPVTPPPPPSLSSDIPSAFQVSASDIPPARPRQPELDCSWLAHTFAQQLPVKLEPINRKIQRPYHFLAAFYDNAGPGEVPVPRLMVRVLDRKKERTFNAEKLKWLPPNDVNQMVVRITGETQGTLYWTVVIDRDNCQVRHVPSKRGAPLIIFPCIELAQINAKRT